MNEWVSAQQMGECAAVMLAVCLAVLGDAMSAPRTPAQSGRTKLCGVVGSARGAQDRLFAPLAKGAMGEFRAGAPCSSLVTTP